MKKMLYKLIVLTVLLYAQNLFAQLSGGDGSSGNPYQIATVADLALMNTYTYLSAPYYFILTSDINLNVNPYNTGTGWYPIGKDIPFVGNFNGNGHKITGVMVNITDANVGLFAHIIGGTVANLGVENVNITSTGNYAGGLVGLAEGNNVSISNCYTTGSVTGANYVGGLVGNLSIDLGSGEVGTIANCYSRASVTATTGPNWGGFIGFANCTISNCYSVGVVSTGGYGFIGGAAVHTITNCFWDMDASGQTTDNSLYDGTTGEHTAAMKTQSTFTGWDFTSTWEIVGTNYPRLQIVRDAELPVELTSFTSTLNKNSVTLNWSTATEVNNFGFNVERRAVNSQESTANNWQKIGFVAGSGTSNSTHKYSYLDASVVSGTYAYRLKQIDNDGTFKYSQSVQVEVQLAPAAIGLNQNYPNPFNPTTMISFAVPSTEHAKLAVYNLLGQPVMMLFDGIANGQQAYNVSFDGSKLASGVYFYRLETPSRIEVKRMQLLK